MMSAGVARTVLVATILTLTAVHAPMVRGQARPSRSKPTVVRLHDGRNPVDLLGTGKPAFVDVGARENFNAHGHHVAMFLLRAPQYPNMAASNVAWEVVPFFGRGTDSATGQEIFRTTEGADCTLRDLRVVRTASDRPVTVVIGERELGRSYADSAAVRFDYYELRVNVDGTVGYPAYYFALARSIGAKHWYCDIDDAFDRELGLGRAGLLQWSGPR